MNITIARVLIVIAIILFVLAAIGVTFGANVSFGWLGLAFFAAAFLAADTNG